VAKNNQKRIDKIMLMTGHLVHLNVDTIFWYGNKSRTLPFGSQKHQKDKPLLILDVFDRENTQERACASTMPSVRGFKNESVYVRFFYDEPVIFEIAARDIVPLTL
jgi:hypothetical protein